MTTALFLAALLAFAPPTRQELLDSVDALRARIAELPADHVDPPPPPPPVDPPHEHPPETVVTVDLPGEGRKIVTHLGLIPDLSVSATHTLASGPFPTNLPPDARVVIPPSAVVDYQDVIDARVESLVLQGMLHFARDKPTRLRVGTILQYPGSHLDLGSVDHPVKTRAEIIFDGQLDTAKDPEQILVGHVAFGGDVSVCGDFEDGTATTTLAAPVAAGTKAITVSAANRWKVGDELYLADSRDWIDTHSYVSWAERATISAIDGTNVTLAAPLKWPHATDVDHLSRNVTFTSAPDSARGHTIYMGDVHAHLCCARYEGMGRTTVALLHDTLRGASREVLQVGANQRGRYPIHAHHPAHPFEFDRLVVIDVPTANRKWGITHHNGHGTVSNCVVIDVNGAGIVGEAGTETGQHFGNSVTRNVKGVGIEDYKRFEEKTLTGAYLDDRGFGGFGFWYRGPFVECFDNKANGYFQSAFDWDQEAGFVPNTFQLSAIEGRPPELVGTPFDLEKTPPRRIENLSIRATDRCLTTWRINTNTTLKNLKAHSQGHFVKNAIVSFHSGDGELTLDDCKVTTGDKGVGAFAIGASFTLKRVNLNRFTASGWKQGLVDPHGVEAVFIDGVKQP